MEFATIDSPHDSDKIPTMGLLKSLLALLLGLFLSSFAFAQPQATTKVLRVVDGDTLRIEFQGKEEKIRLYVCEFLERRPYGSSGSH